MKRFPFKKIDAFAAGGSPGNPAACLYVNARDAITDDEMQAVARQLRGFVNEVVYVFPDKGALFLKYYSSECEVDFCGHGTIAALYDLVKNTRVLSQQPVIKIRVKDEYLQVLNELQKDDAVYITAPAPREFPVSPAPAGIAAALGTEEGAFDARFPIGLLNAGLTTLIVPFKSLDACLSLRPEREVLRSFCLNNSIDIVLVFSQQASGQGHDYRTRVFAPKFGYLEDPATGSGNSAFGYYLLKNGAWDGERLVLEQNGSASKPNIVRLRTREHEGQRRVLFGGGAVIRIAGEYFLYGADE